MAIDARNILSMGTAGAHQIFHLCSMARCTMINWGGVAPAIVGGLVWCMTPDTVGVHHFRSMRFMAIHTLHELSCSSTVLQVAIGARHVRMCAGDSIKSLPYILMAGKTYCGHIIIYCREWFNTWGMRRMTASTAVQCIVCVSRRGMALGTLWDNRRGCRWVSFMTVEATQCGAVSTTLFSYLARWIDVTLDTIRIFEGSTHDLRLDWSHTY